MKRFILRAWATAMVVWVAVAAPMPAITAASLAPAAPVVALAAVSTMAACGTVGPICTCSALYYDATCDADPESAGGWAAGFHWKKGMGVEWVEKSVECGPPGAKRVTYTSSELEKKMYELVVANTGIRNRGDMPVTTWPDQTINPETRMLSFIKVIGCTTYDPAVDKEPPPKEPSRQWRKLNKKLGKGEVDPTTCSQIDVDPVARTFTVYDACPVVEVPDAAGMVACYDPSTVVVPACTPLQTGGNTCALCLSAADCEVYNACAVDPACACLETCGSPLGAGACSLPACSASSLVVPQAAGIARLKCATACPALSSWPGTPEPPPHPDAGAESTDAGTGGTGGAQ